MSSLVSFRLAAFKFSSKYFKDDVPGIGNIYGE